MEVLLLFYKFPSTTIIVVCFKASSSHSIKSLKNFLSESDTCPKLFSISSIIFTQSFFSIQLSKQRSSSCLNVPSEASTNGQIF